MRKTWIGAAAGLLLVALTTGWYFASPAWTLKQMASAAQARDADKLSGYIDYPKLRETTKTQLKAAMTAELASSSSDGFGALGMMVGIAMVDNMIDAMFTPEGMAAMFAKDKAAKGEVTQPKRPMGLDANNRELVREGFNRFRLHEKGQAGQDGDLIFERHGLGWKLAQVQVPTDLFEEKKGGDGTD